MNDSIKIKFDKTIVGYIISMPEFVTLEMIKAWEDRFDKELNAIGALNRFDLLIDSNRHNFESIQCLKRLREYLSNHPKIKTNLSRVAFVAPAKFRKPIIKSEIEAYFDNFERAYKWLEE